MQRRFFPSRALFLRKTIRYILKNRFGLKSAKKIGLHRIYQTVLRLLSDTRKRRSIDRRFLVHFYGLKAVSVLFGSFFSWFIFSPVYLFCFKDPFSDPQNGPIRSLTVVNRYESAAYAFTLNVQRAGLMKLEFVPNSMCAFSNSVLLVGDVESFRLQTL